MQEASIIVMTEPEQQYFQHLCGIMYKTRGCRFNAAEALIAKSRWSIGTVTFLTLYLIGMSIFAIDFPEAVNENRARFVNAFSVFSSLALLILTLMDFAFDRSVKAEKLNINALRISSLMREMERELASDCPRPSSLNDLAARYERELTETEVNHTRIDLTRWEYSKAKSDNTLLMALYVARRRLYDVWFLLGQCLSTLF